MALQKKSYTFDEIKKKIVKYCTYQDRCHQEVEQKMREFLLIPEAKEEILLYLMRENFLNEERFARSYVRGKFYHKYWGKKKIELSLKAKQISHRLIDIALGEISDEDYEQRIYYLYDKYYQSLDNGTIFEKKQKTIKYLLNKGYTYDEIQRAIEE